MTTAILLAQKPSEPSKADVVKECPAGQTLNIRKECAPAINPELYGSFFKAQSLLNVDELFLERTPQFKEYESAQAGYKDIVDQLVAYCKATKGYEFAMSDNTVKAYPMCVEIPKETPLKLPAKK